MTPDQLRVTLASSTNKLAAKALKVIAAGESVAALAELLDRGAAFVAVERDPRHPRSRYLIHSLIAATYETNDFAEPTESERVPAAGGGHVTMVTTTLNPDNSPQAETPRMRVRLEMFKLLLSRGAPDAASNAWRGAFFDSVLKCAFGEPHNSIKVEFARALVAAKPEILARFGRNEYVWHGNLPAYRLFLELGGQPAQPGTLANVLRYIFSGDLPKTKDDGRAAVAHAVIADGGRLSPEEFHEIKAVFTREEGRNLQPWHTAMLQSIAPN